MAVSSNSTSQGDPQFPDITKINAPPEHIAAFGGSSDVYVGTTQDEKRIKVAIKLFRVKPGKNSNWSKVRTLADGPNW